MFVYVDNAEDNLAKPFLTLYGLEAEKPIVSLLVIYYVISIFYHHYF